MVRLFAVSLLVTAASLFSISFVHGQEDDNLFQFTYDNDGNGMGQPHWDRVECRDIGTCVSTEERGSKSKNNTGGFITAKPQTIRLINK